MSTPVTPPRPEDPPDHTNRKKSGSPASLPYARPSRTKTGSDATAARATWRFLARAGAWLKRHAFMVATFAVLASVYATLDFPEVFTARREAMGDGVYYYAWARSLALDGDVDLGNDYAIVGNPFGVEVNPATKHRLNRYPMGSGVLQVPFVWLARATMPVSNWLGWTRDDLRGGGLAFQRVAQFGAVVFGFLAVVLGIRLAERFVPRREALLGGLGVLLGSPLLWYMLRQPSYSHAYDAFAVALFVYVWWRTQGSTRLLRWFGVGALLGLATMVRQQNIVRGVLLLIEGSVLAAATFRARPNTGSWFSFWAARAAAAGLGCLLAFSPQMIAWRVMFGAFLTVPQGGGYFAWNASRFGAYLFSTRYGAFGWHPLLGLGVLGLLVPLVRRRTPAPLRILVGSSLLVFALSAFINGAVEDWWGHWAFGGRRVLGDAVFLILGMALAAKGIADFLERQGKRVARAIPVAVLGACAWFNVSLMQDYLIGKALHEGPQPMKPLWMSAVGKAVDAVYSVSGNWGSIPDNWRFALAAGVSPERYDMAIATDVYNLNSFMVPFWTEAHAMAGFGEPERDGSRSYRWIDGDTGTFVFVVRRKVALTGTVTMRPATPGTRVRMRVGGDVVLDETLTEGFRDYPIRVPRAHTGGVVLFTIEQWRRPMASGWPLGRTGSTLPYEVDMESAMFGSGSHARLDLAGRIRSEFEHGLHVFVLDPTSPQVARWERFDTHIGPAATDRLEAMVAALPTGAVVAAAASYEAFSAWSTGGDRALAGLGGGLSLVGKSGHSYSLIGRKGAASGTAVESLVKGGVSHATVGRPPASRHSGVAYERANITLDPAGT